MYGFDEMPADLLARALAYVDDATAPLKVRIAQLEARVATLQAETRALQAESKDRQEQVAAMDRRLRDRGV